MQSAAVYFLATTLAVTYGWQPMPDGNESYEYIVQLDRELLTRLERGESIPISADIPEDIQSIRRIRLVVGNRDLPRQKLVTALKPEQTGESADVVRGQYSNSAPRYNTQPILPADRQPAQILPSNRQIENTVNNLENRANSSVNALGDALQRSALEARNAVETQILPRNSQPSGNSQIRPRQTADILPRNTTTEPSNRIRNTNSSNDAAIRELFAEPKSNTPPNNVQVADQRSAPDSRYATGNMINNQSILPRGSNSPSGNNNAFAAQPNPSAGSRYSSSTATPNAGSISPAPRPNEAASNSQRINAPWPKDERFQNSPLAQEYDSQNTRRQSSSTPEDRPTQELSAPNPYNFATGAPQNDNQATPNLSFPEQSSFNTAGKSKNSNVPEIRRDMLDGPADAELMMANGNRSTATHASFSQPTATDSTPMNTGNQQSGQGQPFSNIVSTPNNSNQLNAAQSKNTGANTTTMFPLVLAWVLLSGSGAGNLYLVWSYLDIRSKYRGLVRSAGRKLGRGYLDDRYGEPDDYDE